MVNAVENGQESADMAQLAEQLTCNQQVFGSSPNIGFEWAHDVAPLHFYNLIWEDTRVAKGDGL